MNTIDKSIVALLCVFLGCLLPSHGQEAYDPTEDIEHAKAYIFYDYEHEVPVYDEPDGKVITFVQNSDSVIVGVVFIGKTDKMYKVMAYDSYEDTVMVRGWIEREIPLEAYTNGAMKWWTLYEEPSHLKPKVTFYVWLGTLKVLDYDRNWLKGKFTDSEGNSYTGWVPYYYICNNPLSTCS